MSRQATAGSFPPRTEGCLLSTRKTTTIIEPPDVRYHSHGEGNDFGSDTVQPGSFTKRDDPRGKHPHFDGTNLVKTNRMQSPWQTDTSRNSGERDYFNEESNSHGNGWPGNIIERSTSAPPIPTEQFRLMNTGSEQFGGETFLFGSTQSKFVADDNSLFRQNGRDSAIESAVSSSFLVGLRDNTGRATAPHVGYGDQGGALSETMLNSGLDSNAGFYRSGSVGTEFSGIGIDDNRQRDEHMVRSRSAAPSLLDRSTLGPPPGLGINSNSEDAFSSHFGRSQTRGHIMEIGQRRSASTGVLSDPETYSVLSSLGLDMSSDRRDSGAVRPAPKTLMDLIQEDIPNDQIHSRPQTTAPYMERETMSYGYLNQSRSVSPPYSHGVDSHRGYQGQRHHVDQYQEHEDSGYLIHQRDLIHAESGRRHQPYDHGPQQHQQQREPTRGSQFMTVPVMQVQRGGPPARSQSRDPQIQHQSLHQQRSIYEPVRSHGASLHHHQQPSQPYDGPPHIYYDSGQQSGAPSLMSQQPQVQILSSGQAVYVQAQPHFTYNNVQYHKYGQPHGQQNRLQQNHLGHHPHQQVAPESHQHYISVIPVQSDGTQVAYWPHPDMQGGGGMGPTTVVMDSRGGQQPQQRASMSRLAGLSIDRLPQHGKSKVGGNVGTRSPPNVGGKVRGGRTAGRGRNDSHAKNIAGTPSVSPLLEEFRVTKTRDWTMLDIEGHVVEFCQDQNGSRFIQQRLEIRNANEQQVVMKEVLPAVRQLRNDVFGNYVVQKLLEFGTPKMKTSLRDTLQGEMLPLSLQMYGCRVVQKALEALSEDDLPQLLMEFHQSVLSCIHDQNGNHVIQKCIEVLSLKSKQATAVNDGYRADFFCEQIDFIIDDVLNNVVLLSCHPYGCRVLQRILEHCVEEKKCRALDDIAKCHKVLLDDQYGNYVIQHVLQYGRNSDRQSVLGIVVENGLLTLSKQKFASNVVEKLLKYGTPSQINALVREMLKRVSDSSGTGDTSSSVVLLMVRDAYANYVVQTTLDVVSEGDEKILLLEELNAHLTQLRNYTFAKHIVTKLSS